ncbi:MAG TPA: Ig-like domain-containing protein [Allosphingosinicella sp.]|jgi:Ca2+-binding RTX toxin-like protein
MALSRIDYGWNGQPGITMKFSQVSSTGRYLLFEGEGEETMGLDGASLFVRDLATGKTETVAFKLDGSLVSDANASFMSGDGRYVVYTSAQNNIVAGDLNNASDVFRFDRVTGQTVLVSADWQGGSADHASLSAGISANGRYVVFFSQASDLTDPANHGPEYVQDLELFVRDVQTGVTRQYTFSADYGEGGIYSVVDDLPLLATGVDDLGRPAYFYYHYEELYGQAYEGYAGHYISGSVGNGIIDATSDGRENVVSSVRGAYLSADRHLPGTEPGEQQSLILDGPDWAEPIEQFELADGGRYVVFLSDFDPTTKAWAPGIYVWDLHAGPILPATGTFATVFGLRPGAQVFDLAISADGKTVTFRYDDAGTETMSSGTYRADNPIWSGTSDTPIEPSPPAPVDPTDLADYLVGTSTSETMHGLGGDDKLFGAAGDDTLHGDWGADQLFGNVGDDTLLGGTGGDRLEGGKGDDTLDGGEDEDVLLGGDGADELRGGKGDDQLDGGAGSDKLFLDAGNDKLDGGEDEGGADIDTLVLTGNAGHYDIADHLGTGGAAGYTRIAADSTGQDEVRGVERLTFDGLRTNVVDQSNIYLTLAKAADAAYADVASMGEGWRPLSALELGMEMKGTLVDGVTDFTYANGVFSAIGPAPVGGFPIEAAAHVYFGVVDGRNTLMLAIRGTDSLSDTQDYPNFRLHAERFEPLIKAVLEYIENGGYAEGGHIDQVYVSGHSLGGATVQQIMADPRIAGNPLFTGATFGSPGSERHEWDPRIVHFEHSADLVPLSGDVARFAATGLKAPFLVTSELANLFSRVLDGVDTPTDFHTAGSVVRLSTINLTGVFPGAQHSMTTYVESVRNFVAQGDKFPVVTGGAPAIPGSPQGHISVLVGSDQADILDGAVAPLIQLLRGADYFDGSEIVVGGGGTDLIGGGSGSDVFAGTRAEHDNDMLSDLSGGEVIRVYGDKVFQGDINYVATGLDGGLLGIGGAIIRIGGFHSGGFFVKEHVGGPHPYTDIVYLGPIQLLGGVGDDTLAGGDGDDTLNGGLGADRLEGGEGADTLSGDGRTAGTLQTLAEAHVDGDDILDGGLGADVMTGGAGQDRFILRTDAADRITDFETGGFGDVIDTTYAVMELGVKENPFMGGFLRLEADGAGGTRLIMDGDGLKGAGAGTVIATFDGVRPEDFTAENFGGGVVGVDPTRTAAAIHGSHDSEIIHGTAGNDDIIGHRGIDKIFGGEGDDRIWAEGAGSLESDNSDPVDPVGEPWYSEDGQQIVEGGAGDDRLQGGNSFDWLYGGDGDDWINGSYEVNRLFGGNGNDVIDLYDGNDHAWGGAGRDLFIAGGPAGDWIMDFEAGVGLGDVVDLSRYTQITSFDQLIFEEVVSPEGSVLYISANVPDQSWPLYITAAFAGLKVGDIVRDDVILAGDLPQAGRGAWGNDRLAGTSADDAFRMDDGGRDVVSGKGGNDSFYFGDAFTVRDQVSGGAGDADTLMLQGEYAGARALVLGGRGLEGIERVELMSGADTRFGHGGDLRFSYDVTAADWSSGGAGQLTLDAHALVAGETLHFDGSAQLDPGLVVVGGDGADTVTGSEQADDIDGGGGSDVLDGAGGDDRITGGVGTDYLTGGAGNDVFAYQSVGQSDATGHDIIDDFTTGDRIELSAIDADVQIDGKQAFNFIGGADFSGHAGELRARNDGNLWTVEADVDGDGTADFLLEVISRDNHVLSRGDFLLGGEAPPSAALDDSGAVAEDRTVSIDVLANDSGAGRQVASIDGKAVSVGVAVTLASGATVTLEANGTLTYDPAGAFDSLAGQGSGAENLQAEDSFTYTIAGGAAATVKVTVHGVTSEGDELIGGTGDNVFEVDDFSDEVVEGANGGNDTVRSGIGSTTDYAQLYTLPANIENFVGTSAGGQGVYDNGLDNRFTMGDGADLVVLTGGGGDKVQAGAGNDFVYVGEAWSAGDAVDGGAGYDTIGFHGGGTFAFGGEDFTGIEQLAFYGSNPVPLPVTYSVTLHDGNVAAGKTMLVNFQSLGSDEGALFNGAAEHDGNLAVRGGRAADSLTGGSGKDNLYGNGGSDMLSGGIGNDVLTGGAGADDLYGGAGKDKFVFGGVGDSNVVDGIDVLHDFGLEFGERIDLSAIDANVDEAGDQAFTFLGKDAAFTEVAGQLRVVGENGNWFVQGDVDGDGNADLVIQVSGGGEILWGVKDFLL